LPAATRRQGGNKGGRREKPLPVVASVFRARLGEKKTGTIVGLIKSPEEDTAKRVVVRECRSWVDNRGGGGPSKCGGRGRLDPGSTSKNSRDSDRRACTAQSVKDQSLILILRTLNKVVETYDK